VRLANTVRHLEHIAALPLGPHIAIPEMLRTLDTVWPGSASGFFWVDPRGSIVDVYAPGENAPVAPSLACQGLLHDDRAAGVQLNLTVAGRLRGVLSLRSRSATAAFSERDRDTLRAIVPAFQSALEAKGDLEMAFDEAPEATSVVVITPSGKWVSVGSGALQLLAQMDGQSVVSPTLNLTSRVPSFLADLAAPKRAAASPILQKVTRWGCYRARAIAQSNVSAGEEATTAVIVTKHLPTPVRTLRALGRCDLSPRERQVAFQLASGIDAASAAAALDVSLVTWRTYVKRVYQRLDVRGRLDLLARIQEKVAIAA